MVCNLPLLHFFKLSLYVCGLLMIGFGAIISAKGQSLKLDDLQKKYVLGQYIEILEDSTQQITFEDILSGRLDAQFVRSKQDIPNYGYSNNAFWIKLRLQNASSAQWLLQFSQSLADYLDFYLVDAQGKVRKVETGAYRPFSNRDIAHPTFLFDLPELQNQGVVTLFFHFYGNSAKNFNLVLLEKNYFIKSSQQENLVMGIYFGFFVVMIIYNLFLYIGLRIISYLHYVLFIVSFLLLQLALFGIVNQYNIWVSPRTANISNLLFAGLTGYYGVIFVKSFLQLKQTLPTVNRWLWLFEVLNIALCVATLVSIYYPPLLRFLPRSTGFILLTSCIAVMAAGMISLLNGNRSARFYMLAWTVQLAGGIIYVLSIFGILPSNDFSRYALRVGSALEVLLLSLGLADWFTLAEQEKQKAQHKAIATLQEKENFIIEQNKILEKQVKVRTQQLQNQSELLAQQNENILSGINYAKNIQQAMLPPLEEIQQVFSQSFIFFKPRDIVSGDFYYYKKNQDYAYLAAIDCTGHGVPGALMSIIAHNLLEDIISQQQIIGIHDILTELHQGVRKLLRQAETSNRDGMDIGLISLHFPTRTVHFAGARSNAYIVQKDAIYIIKGERKSIGGEQAEQNRSFHLQPLPHAIDLQKPSMLFLCTDGYADQFGGQEGKKFGWRQLRELLTQIAPLEMSLQQKALAKNIENWVAAGQEEQIDDILIIGLRL